MSEFPHLRIGRGTAIDFTDHGLRRRVAHVVEPGFDGDFRGGFGQIAEAYEICAGRRIGPDGVFQFGRHTRRLRRVETWTGQLEDAAELEIIANDLSEKGTVGLGRVRTRYKIRDGQAWFVSVHADRGPKPILARRRLRTANEDGEN